LKVSWKKIFKKNDFFYLRMKKICIFEAEM